MRLSHFFEGSQVAFRDFSTWAPTLAHLSDVVEGGMSRKRQRRREKESEMARQLGVKSLDDRARELVAKGRVGHVELRLNAVEVLTDHDGFLARRRKRPLTLSAQAFLVDGHGVHNVASAVATTADAPAPSVSHPLATRTKESVRYERPAHFVVVVTADVGAKPEDVDDAPLLAFEGHAPVQLDADSISKRLSEPFTPCRVLVGESDSPGAFVVLPGVHKTSTAAIASVDHPRLTLELSLDIRL